MFAEADFFFCNIQFFKIVEYLLLQTIRIILDLWSKLFEWSFEFFTNSDNSLLLERRYLIYHISNHRDSFHKILLQHLPFRYPELIELATGIINRRFQIFPKFVAHFLLRRGNHVRHPQHMQEDVAFHRIAHVSWQLRECLIIRHRQFRIDGDTAVDRTIFHRYREIGFGTFQLLGENGTDFIFVILEQQRNTGVEVQLLTVQCAYLDGQNFSVRFQHSTAEACHWFNHKNVLLQKKRQVAHRPAFSELS